MARADLEAFEAYHESLKEDYLNPLKKDIEDLSLLIRGVQKAVSFGTYADMVKALNQADGNKYFLGQSIYISKENVPDLWVSSVLSTSTNYWYISDDLFLEELKERGVVDIGYYSVSALEADYSELVGDISSALDELHGYAQNLVNGGTV